MKLEITTNFSFKKLSNSIEKIIKDTTSNYAKKTEKGAKSKIDRGLPKLNDVTEKIRKQRGQPIRPALKATGNLYNSIKQREDNLEMLEYGLLHNKGFTTGKDSMIPNKPVKPRPFISATIKDKKEIQKEFVKQVDKALKK